MVVLPPSIPLLVRIRGDQGHFRSPDGCNDKKEPSPNERRDDRK